MEPFSISCPGCGSRFAIRNPEVLGQTRACPKCTSPIEIVDPHARFSLRRRSMLWNRRALLAGVLSALLLFVIAFALMYPQGAEPTLAGRGQPLAAGQRPDIPKDQQGRAQVAPPKADAKDNKRSSQTATNPNPAHNPRESSQTDATQQAPSAAPDSAQAPPGASSGASAHADGTSPQEAAARSSAPHEKPEPLAPTLPEFSLEAFLGGATRSAPDDETPESQATAESPESSSSGNEADAPAEKDNPPVAPPGRAEKIDPVVVRRLKQKIAHFEYQAIPFDRLIEELSEVSGLEIVIDYPKLKNQRFKFDTPITLRLSDTSPAQILQRIVEPLKLAYRVSGKKVVITGTQGQERRDQGSPAPGNPP